jgi:MFS transporter, DHA3 family, macrolide efflux protein
MDEMKPGLRNFLLIWFGQLVSGVGSRLTSFALGVWVYDTTGSTTQFAMVFVAMAVPVVLVSPFAGALVDRWDRRRTMIVCESISIVVIAALALSAAIGELSMWQIYLGVGSTAVANCFLQPAYAASVPLLADRDQLVRLNGMIQTGQGFALVGGPALAGVLMQFFGLSVVLLVDALTFAVGAICIAIARIPRPPRDEAGEQNLIREARDGWAYIAERPGLLGLLTLSAASSFVFAIASIAITPLVLSVANDDKALLGLQMSLSCSGLLVGGLLITIWGGPRQKIHSVLGFSIFSGLMIAIHGLAPSLTLLIVAGFLMFLSIPPAQSASYALWQSKVPSQLLGRCFAMLRMTSEAALPLGYLLAGPLAEYVFEPALMPGGALASSIGRVIGVGEGRGLGFMFIVMGLTMSAIAAVGYAMRSVREIDRALPDAPLANAEAAATG